MELPKDELIKYFRFEASPGMNRLKCWWWAYFYYYDCKADRQLLGKFFKQAMKIGGGVRSYKGYELPIIVVQLETLLMQLSILKRKSDAVAINVYKKTSGIDFHFEGDRYGEVIGCVFCSSDDIRTFLSINQSGINGTTEVDIESLPFAVWRFNSYVFFFC